MHDAEFLLQAQGGSPTQQYRPFLQSGLSGKLRFAFPPTTEQIGAD